MRSSTSRDKRNGNHVSSMRKRMRTMETQLEKICKILKKKSQNERRLSRKRSSFKRKRILSSSSDSTENTSDQVSEETTSTEENWSSDGTKSETTWTSNCSTIEKNLNTSKSMKSPRSRSRKSNFNKFQINKRIHEVLDDSLGDTINDIPERIKNSLSNDIDESEYFELMKKYKVPLNLSMIKPKLLSDDVKLSCEMKNLDNYFVSIQTKLFSVIGAIISSLPNVKMGPLSIKASCKDTKTKLEDAAILAIHLQNDIKEFRLSNIMPEIESESQKAELYSIFCADYDADDNGTIESDDEKVLNYLENISGDNNKLTLPELSRKLVFLLHYNSHKNIETLSKLKLNNITSINGGRKFTVPEEEVEFIIKKNDNSKLCVIEALEEYLQQTHEGRDKEDSLFLLNRKRGHHYPAVSLRRMNDWINELRKESHAWNLRKKR